MFWQKPFVFLGLLAAVGSTNPTLSKRLDLESLDEEFVFFRADRYVSLGCRVLAGHIVTQHTSLGPMSEYSSPTYCLPWGNTVYSTLLTCANHPFTNRRGAEVIRGKGFNSLGKDKGLPENLSLWDHCKEKGAADGFGNLQNDGYVSTSSDFSVCKEWVEDKIEDTSATIYKIASYENLIGCQLTLGKCTYTCSHSHRRSYERY
jgi:hypothetical protein